MIDPTDEADPRHRQRTNGRHNGEAHDDRLRKVEVLVATQAAGPRMPSAAEPLVFDAQGHPLVPAVVAPPDGAVFHPPGLAQTKPWTVSATLGELRTTARMYFDPRYRVSRLTQFAVPAVLLLFVLNYFFFALWFPVPVLSPILERVICVLLGVLLYKMLTRELARYREVLDYLSRHGFHR
jgi:hypothetical protein